MSAPVPPGFSPPSAQGCAVDPVTGAVLETAELRAYGLAELRRLLAVEIAAGKLARLPRDDDRFLLAFLRARKYKVGDVCSCVVSFAKFWFNPKYRHLIEGVTPESVREQYVGSPSKLLLGRDAHGNAVCTIDAAAMDPRFLGFEGTIRSAVLLLAWVFENEDVQLHGVTYVETFEGFSLGAAMRLRNIMSGPEQAELREIFLGTFPIRIRHFYVIRQPWYFSVIWAIAKLFITKKLRDRVRLFGGDVAGMLVLVPPHALPARFGGTLVEAPGHFIDHCTSVAAANGGAIGGFRIPFSVDEAAAAAAPPREGSMGGGELLGLQASGALLLLLPLPLPLLLQRWRLWRCRHSMLSESLLLPLSLPQWARKMCLSVALRNKGRFDCVSSSILFAPVSRARFSILAALAISYTVILLLKIYSLQPLPFNPPTLPCPGALLVGKNRPPAFLEICY